MITTDNIHALQDIAASQWGMFTAAQAARIGIGRVRLHRMLKDGRIERLRTGVYMFASVPLSRVVPIAAAWLATVPAEYAFERLAAVPCDVVLAGSTAAYLHDAGNLYAEPYTFIVSTRRQSSQEDMRYLRWGIEPCDIGRIEGIPVTKAERTIADLVRLRVEPEHLRSVVEDFLASPGCVDERRLAELLAPLAARNGFARRDGATFARELLSLA